MAETSDDLNSSGTESDPLIQQLLSQISKQNQTTKRKGLRDLCDALKGRQIGDDESSAYKRSAEEIVNVFPQWAVAFGKLIDDDHCETRILSAELNAVFVVNSEKLLARHLGKILPAWYAACYDEDELVSETSRSAFEQVFSSPEKRAQVLSRYGKDILQRLNDRLCFDTTSEQSSVTESGTSEERRERRERTIAAAMNALGGFTKDSVGAKNENKPNPEIVELILGSLEVIPGDGIVTSSTSHSAKIRNATYQCVLRVVAVFDSSESDLARIDRMTTQSEKLKRVALFHAVDETDATCLGSARELTLGFIERKGAQAWTNDIIYGFLSRLEQHVASGCHGAADISAPSVLPLLAGLPDKSLAEMVDGTSSQKNLQSRLSRLLTHVWDGYNLCNVPSRAADAKALLNAFKEAFLFGTIVVAERLGTEGEKKTFRDELFEIAITNRWAPETFAGTCDASVLNSLCETLVGVSRRQVLAQGLELVMHQLTSTATTMLRDNVDTSNISETGVDTFGALRIAAFHENLVQAALNRDTSERANPPPTPSNTTAITWVKHSFAIPVARSVTKLLSQKPSKAGADLLRSFVKHHGPECLADRNEGNDSGVTQDTTGDTSGLVDACFENAAQDLNDRALTLAAVARASPETWDLSISRANELNETGDASGLGLLASALTILGSDATGISSWSRPALDTLVVSAVGAHTDIDANHASLVMAAAATGSVSASAATEVLRNLSKSITAISQSIESFTAAEAWVWPIPVTGEGDTKYAWLGLVSALWSARLDEATENTDHEEIEETFGEETGCDSDSDSDDERSETSSDASSVGNRARSVSPDAASHPASRTWARLERKISEEGHVAQEQERLEVFERSARDAIVGETSKRLYLLETSDTKNNPAARRIAGATATALAAFGLDAFTAAEETTLAALTVTSTDKNMMSEIRSQYLGETAVLFGSWSFVLDAVAMYEETVPEIQKGTTVAFMLRSGVSKELTHTLCEDEHDRFVDAVSVLIEKAIDDGVEFGEWFFPNASELHKTLPQPCLYAAKKALTVVHKCLIQDAFRIRSHAAKSKRLGDVFTRTIGKPFTQLLNDTSAELDAKKIRTLSSLVPLLRGVDSREFDTFAHAAAKRAGLLLSREGDAKQQAVLGPVVALAAACYRETSADGKIIVSNKSTTDSKPLLSCFQLATRREAASAAAAAAAARSASLETNGQQGTGTSRDTSNEKAISEHSEEKNISLGLLTLAVMTHCTVDLDVRDWERIVQRLEGMCVKRVAYGEECCELAAQGEGANIQTESTYATGWRCAKVATQILLAFEKLPVVVAAPDFDNNTDGDVVPFGVQGMDAQTIAASLARIDWPSVRSEIHGSIARALMAAGAELYHLKNSNERKKQWFARRAGEMDLWRYVAKLWSTGSGAEAVAANKILHGMHQWEEAGCGAIASLYETLLCADDLFGDVGNIGDRKNITETCSSLRQSSYALLSSPALVKPAVVGLDASVEDTDAVVEAVLGGDEDDGEDESGDETPAAERAAIREPLALKLSRKEGDDSNTVLCSPVQTRGRGRLTPHGNIQSALRGVDEQKITSTLLCYALLLRHLQVLPLNSKSRERLAEFTNTVKAVPTVMRLALVHMPIPGDGNFVTPSKGKTVLQLPTAWQAVVALSSAAGKDGRGGSGAATAAANADVLSPRFLFGGGNARTTNKRLAIGIYRACLQTLPAATRTWFQDCRDVGLKKTLESLTASALSPAILEQEFDLVERAATGKYSGFSFGEHDADSTGELSVKVLRLSREISATYSLDDAAVELKVILPKAYPLVQAELTSGQRAGVSEARARKWTLAVGSILRHQNGAVANGLATWRRNVDREFAGVEPCPICYLVIHGSNHQLPKLKCNQCHNSFHNACLYKWFTSSSKSTCPLCQTPWGTSYRS